MMPLAIKPNPMKRDILCFRIKALLKQKKAIMELNTTPNISKKKWSMSCTCQIEKNERNVITANGMHSKISAIFNFESEKKDDGSL